ncbi:E3 ubiquitin ligase PQT3-like isoform X3 [Alnus glutinosa]|nr:E3 ubiquitin ligase PQT3-like isoform X3 [Alnus glutinosa]
MVNAEPEKSSLPATVASTMIYPEDSEWNDFWNDVNGPSNPTVETPPTNIADEESKIKALIDTPALDWQCQGPDGFGPSRGFERGIGGKMGGHGFGFEWETPPQGYVCHRCKVPGHFIQHCRTNGDPKFDIERVKPPTDIPKSLLMATPDGSYALSSGAVAVLEPNGAAFEKEMEGVPSTYSVGELPPELYCRLCKEVLKDAVLAKCCFESFCEKCIRNHIISKTTCVCGKKNIVADDLLPNKTLRHTINRILEGGSSSSENAGSTFPVRGMESARLLPKVPSPTLSAASKGEQKQSPVSEETPKIHETGDEGKAATFPQRTAKKGTQKAADLSEFPHESVSVREITSSLESAPLAEEEVHQKVPTSEAGKKKEKKKARIPAIDLQWKTSRDLAAENNIMPSGPSAFNPYWTGMQPGAMAYMGYGIRPFDMPFGGIAPQDPFGAQGYMFTPIPPQREFSNDWEFGGVVNRVADVPSTKLKSVCLLYCTNCPLPYLFLYCSFMKGREIVLFLLLRLNNGYFRSYSSFVFNICIFNDALSNYGVIMGRECQSISNFDFSIYAYLAIKCTSKVAEYAKSKRWFDLHGCSSMFLVLWTYSLLIPSANSSPAILGGIKQFFSFFLLGLLQIVFMLLV